MGEVDYMAARVLDSFWKLPDLIITKYADGWLSDGDALGYPDWWLKAVGYENGPPPPPSSVENGSTDISSLERCVRACPSGQGFWLCMQSCDTEEDVIV